MALEFAHGAVQWLSADAATTTYTVSGLGFEPLAIRFYWMGLGSATDTSSTTTHGRRGLGFATSTSDRRCVGTEDQDGTAASTCTSGVRDDCIAATFTATGPACDGRLDITTFGSDGFTLTVDDAAPVNITVFWEAWGGSDITVAATGEISEPASTGDVDYSVTGFTSGGTDQVVMFAGVMATGATPSVARLDSYCMFGYASSGSTDNNIVTVGGADDGATTTDTDAYAVTGECLAMLVAGGGNPDARATLTQFGTDNFRLNWIARAQTGRKYIFLAIKGGSWEAASTTLNYQTNGNTTTVTGIAFPPIGLCMLNNVDPESTAGTSGGDETVTLGTGTSSSSRRSMGLSTRNNQANADVALIISYDTAGGVLFNATTYSFDLTAMNSDGFQFTYTGPSIGSSFLSWIGYLTFGDAPVGGGISIPVVYHHRQRNF